MVTSLLSKFEDIHDARQELKAKNLSFIDPRWKRLLRRVLRDNEGGIGDFLKSWDVHLANKFIGENLSFEDKILDLGCHKSELVPVLNAVGYKNLYGIDLNENTRFSMGPKNFTFKKGDFYEMPIENETMNCISAISVIEHGYDGDGLFREVSRVLKSGGFFIASYDFWPNKVDVKGRQFFGLPWIIFDNNAVNRMDEYAKSHSMKKLKATKSFNLTEPVIKFDGFEYTFAMSIYQKH